MGTTAKLQTWIILLLIWNALLLMFLIAFLLLTNNSNQQIDNMASQCREAALTVLKDSCRKP